MADRAKMFKPQRGTGSKKFSNRTKLLRMYDYAWQKYTKAFLKINHLCYACGVKATVVDHLRPHKGDEKLFKQLDNHIPLCAKCHNTITGKFDRHRESKFNEKLEFLAVSRELNNVTHKVKVLPRYD